MGGRREEGREAGEERERGREREGEREREKLVRKQGSFTMPPPSNRL